MIFFANILCKSLLKLWYFYYDTLDILWKNCKKE